jgi:hypothetical protein
MIDDIRELFQSLLVPQLEGIKGELKSVNVRIDSLEMALGARIDAVDTKIESYRRETIAEIRRVEETLSADFVRIESNVDVRLTSMDQRMESLRRELLAEIKAAR